MPEGCCQDGEQEVKSEEAERKEGKGGQGNGTYLFNLPPRLQARAVPSSCYCYGCDGACPDDAADFLL